YCKDCSKLGKSQLHNLQKSCYSLGLGSCRKLRVNPDISIAAKKRGGPEEVASKKAKRSM
ncbi:hypothetical protein, partial [Achromobacter sp. ACM04]|uniref:hypothetical protein n=1 Tax=Achromobacter sp. ACM04 TaxID=2769312 RepID=UPI001CE1089A